MVTIAITGCGYWGPNLLRNFDSLADARVKTVCDTDRKAIDRLKKRYPSVAFTSEWNDVLKDKEIDAVVIALPTELHAGYAKQALDAGKHVFVEKPLAMTVAESRELQEISEKSGLTLMVGHLLLYHPAVTRLKELVDSGELGTLYYLYSQRLNLGVIRKRENALLSLAPHDVSVLLYLLNESPEAVSATGASYINDGIEDTVFLHLKFSERKMAHVHVSWLDPHRIRRFTVVGEKKMAVFDDVEPVEKLKVFDKGVERPSYASYGEVPALRFGDIAVPRLDATEPLRAECRHFIDCVAKGARPRTDAASGVEVVRVLEAAQRSLREGGKETRL